MTTRLFIYLSEVLGNPVLSGEGRKIGRLKDIAMSLSNEAYPGAKGIIVERGLFRKSFGFVLLEKVKQVDHIIQLSIEKEDIVFENNKYQCDFALSRDILDQQVVDTEDQKVVRVNDVHLLRVDNQIHLAHVDVGMRGLVRRLGWTRLVDGCVKLFNGDSPYLSEEELLPWKYTQALSMGRLKNVLRMDVARKKLSKIPPTALAEIMQDLDIFEKLSLFKSFDANIQHRIFADLAPDDKLELIDQLEDSEAARIVSSIPADEATDLLLDLPKHETQKLMRLMGSETAKKLRKLLGFAEDSAGGLMTTEYLHLSQDATVEDAMQKVKDNVQMAGNIFFIYIVDENHKFLGTTSLRRFINEDPQKLVIETCYNKEIFVNTDDGMEEVALLLEQYKFSSIPVLNEEQILQGVITMDDVMEELISMTWKKYKDQI